MGWEWNQQPFEFTSDGSNMALMLIRLRFLASAAHIPAQPRLYLECAVVAVKTKHSEMMLLLLLALRARLCLHATVPGCW